MTNTSRTSSLLTAITGLFLSSSAAFAADAPKVEFPQASPNCTLKQHLGLSEIEIVYSRPSVKGREIFGGLVPYDKIWRTGANQATKLTLGSAAKFNNNEIPAGTYALMTIPGKDEWTIIINKGPDQWGAYKYDEKADLVRFKVKPVSLAKSVETFSIDFNNIRDESAELDLTWDKTQVPIKVEFDFTDKIVSQIEAAMASDGEKKPYFQAANFYLNHGKDLKKAKEWIELAVKERDAHYIVFVKAQILAKLGEKDAAIAAAKHSSELAEKANDLGYVKQNADLIKSLK